MLQEEEGVGLHCKGEGIAIISLNVAWGRIALLSKLNNRQRDFVHARAAVHVKECRVGLKRVL